MAEDGYTMDDIELHETCKNYMVSEDKINKASRLRLYPYKDCSSEEIVDDVLETLGIYKCLNPGCHAGYVPNGSGVSPCSEPCPSCKGRGWNINA